MHDYFYRLKYRQKASRKLRGKSGQQIHMRFHDGWGFKVNLTKDLEINDNCKQPLT